MRRKYGYILDYVIDKNSDGEVFIRSGQRKIVPLNSVGDVWGNGFTVYYNRLLARIALKRFDRVYQNNITNGL